MNFAIQKFITNPANADYLGLLKGARNGLVYGAKVRFPHALVVAVLFGHGEHVPFFKLWFRNSSIYVAAGQHEFRQFFGRQSLTP